ncbi:hypothetical protein [Seonamhaeicola maritimus]|uniref:hypothetical protein n=1 Tax=Seonamhaeicola maritimus TaxID=2591822 RepID=UPI002494742C|nr:hypothetical protein [Seonamhaeicola maritimus]
MTETRDFYRPFNIINKKNSFEFTEGDDGELYLEKVNFKVYVGEKFSIIKSKTDIYNDSLKIGNVIVIDLHFKGGDSSEQGRVDTLSSTRFSKRFNNVAEKGKVKYEKNIIVNYHWSEYDNVEVGEFVPQKVGSSILVGP